MLAIPRRVIAACFGLVGFAAAAIAGMAAGNHASHVLLRAMAVLVVAWGVGYVIGIIAQQAVDEHIARYKEQNPIPQQEPLAQEADASEASGGSPQQEAVT